jgi:hypothetical protein
VACAINPERSFDPCVPKLRSKSILAILEKEQGGGL